MPRCSELIDVVLQSQFVNSISMCHLCGPHRIQRGTVVGDAHMFELIDVVLGLSTLFPCATLVVPIECNLIDAMPNDVHDVRCRCQTCSIRSPWCRNVLATLLIKAWCRMFWPLSLMSKCRGLLAPNDRVVGCSSYMLNESILLMAMEYCYVPRMWSPQIVLCLPPW